LAVAIGCDLPYRKAEMYWQYWDVAGAATGGGAVPMYWGCCCDVGWGGCCYGEKPSFGGCSGQALSPGDGGCWVRSHLLQQLGYPLQFLDGFGAFELH